MMNKHLWSLALMPLAVAGTAHAYDVQQQPKQQQASLPFDQHTDWAYTDNTYSPNALHYRPLHFQIEGGPVITQRSAAQDLNNGWNAGAGITWYPSRYIPFGIRADASYSRFGARQSLLDKAASQAGTDVDSGIIERWGGDLDGEIDVPLGPEARLYLVGGVGWYKTHSVYRQNSGIPATVCNWWGCMDGYINVTQVVSRNTSDRQFARNVGIGVEWGLAPGTSFFVEARYERLGNQSRKMDIIPVRFGLRF